MEKPILFNTAMVQEILKGNKTSTRRPVKRTPSNDDPSGYGFWKEYDERTQKCYVKDYTHAPVWWSLKEYISRFSKYHVGDILWVRETWQDLSDNKGEYVYFADGNEGLDDKGFGVVNVEDIKWRPSIHMPRAAARIFLKVTDVRIERLQDITEEDARKEGCFMPSYKDGELVGSSVTLFKVIWDNIYKNWNENPWVWVFEFEKVEGKDESK